MKLLDHVMIPDGRIGVIIGFQPKHVVVRAPAPNPNWPWAVVETLPRHQLTEVEIEYGEALL